MILVNTQTKTIFISLSTLPEELFILLARVVQLGDIPQEVAASAANGFLGYMAQGKEMN